MLTPEDRVLLKQFLANLRGGKTKVLITSRSREDWLGGTNRSVLELAGLHHEERWEYCRTILRDLGIKPNQNDPEWVKLMEALVIGLVVLQTHVKIERDKAGRYSFKIEKRPTQEGLLKKLAELLIPRLGG